MRRGDDAVNRDDSDWVLGKEMKADEDGSKDSDEDECIFPRFGFEKNFYCDGGRKFESSRSEFESSK
ncbi:hypothetical protein PIB30_072946 [Stylosanthes scabra]|uniref:Uncharacterized protein n=1 Tax=Stylosanthes scabra TaxID=79078 RepID=A0ABU6VP85_9FABA|nr:hypothetical protein [Stylosanthes scabra]